MTAKAVVLPLAIFLVAASAGAAGVYAYLTARDFRPPIIAANDLGTQVSGVSAAGDFAAASNVYMEDGTQIIEIQAKGNYTPALTRAKAGLPSILRLVTKDTFDCTSIVAIPSMGYQARLPLSGATDIPLAAQAAGTTLVGICGMAMFRFDIEFSA